MGVNTPPPEQAVKTVPDRRKGRMTTRQHTPVASRGKSMPDGIKYPAQEGVPWPSHTPLLRQQWLNRGPFIIRQIILHVIVFSLVSQPSGLVP